MDVAHLYLKIWVAMPQEQVKIPTFHNDLEDYIIITDYNNYNHREFFSFL